ncbi:MAG: ankyrin repeat domain-containing protein, partial [Candidatus Omnitrophica bacterium]|nr:ankyrin repeat domain-containing protein [Candidatus Omnitrophota bacterium]
KELNAVSNNPEEIVSATHEEVKNPVSENPSEVADTIHNEVRVDMSDQKSDSSGIAPLLDAHDKVRKATERLKNIPKILNATNSSQIKGKLLSTRESELNPADLTKKTKAGVEELQNIIDDLDKRLKSKEPIITEGQNLSPAKVVGSNQNKPLPQDIFVKSIVDGVASDNKIKSLIKEGAEVNFRIGSSMDTPLIYTVRHGRQLLARDLVKNGANLNMQDSKGDTALHVAVANEDADMVRMLVEHGANRYIRNRNGNIPANLAMNKRNESNQKITDLLKSGLQNRQYNSEFPEVREGKFKEQFHISQGLLDEVVALIDHGSNVDSSIGYGFVTPLIYAVECRRADVVEKLIKNGANLNMQDANGDTALHHAAALGDLKMVKLLLKSGAEPEALNEKYRCPIDRAKLRNHQEVVKFLDGYQNNLKAKARQFDLSSKDVISEDDERKVIPGI